MPAKHQLSLPKTAHCSTTAYSKRWENKKVRKSTRYAGMGFVYIPRADARVARTGSGPKVYRAAYYDADPSPQGIRPQKIAYTIAGRWYSVLKLKTYVRRTGLAWRLLNKAGVISHRCSNTEWRKLRAGGTSVLACDAACEGMQWVVGCVVARRFKPLWGSLGLLKR